jgi:hypothetical protein
MTKDQIHYFRRHAREVSGIWSPTDVECMLNEIEELQSRTSKPFRMPWLIVAGALIGSTLGTVLGYSICQIILWLASQ